ncbi:MAG TPA: DUF3450 domain-containing protein [Woeseiaceae bacterium]
MIRRGWNGIGRTIAVWGPRAGSLLLALGVAASAGAQQQNDPATRYAELMHEIDSYGDYNAYVTRLLQSQQADIEALGQQIAGLEGTQQAVQPLVQRMFTSLEQFVANDIPFLESERRDRIDTLRGVVEGEDTVAEKFRRLLEAYMIEIEYGRTMDAYPGKLPDGRDAQFVHLGRISLMYRTTDGKETGYWDRNARQWVVDPAYSRAIETAIRMSEETVAPDLVTLPVPAAEESRS